MTSQPRRGKGRGGDQFEGCLTPEADDAHLADPDADLAEQRSEVRLAYTLAELTVCFDDGAELVAMGKEHFDESWMARRAARNIVAEFAETARRLPLRYRDEHRDVRWRDAIGMRNRIVHAYEHTDHEVVWAVLADVFPSTRDALGI